MPIGLFCVLAVFLANGHAEAVRNPDLTGIWTPHFVRGEQVEVSAIRWPTDPPYTEYGQSLWNAYAAEFDPVSDDPAKYCVLPGMPTSMIGTPTFPVEIFQRPQDITMMIEAYYQYRKIYMEGFDRPDPILPTRMGYAVGHWEDESTLVVETTDLSERDMGRIMMSGDTKIVERIHVEDREDGLRLLIDDITLTDALIYREPIHMRGVWRWSPDTPIMEYVCSQNIYDEHIAEIRRRAENGD